MFQEASKDLGFPATHSYGQRQASNKLLNPRSLLAEALNLCYVIVATACALRQIPDVPQFIAVARCIGWHSCEATWKVGTRLGIVQQIGCCWLIEIKINEVCTQLVSWDRETTRSWHVLATSEQRRLVLMAPGLAASPSPRKGSGNLLGRDLCLGGFQRCLSCEPWLA
ncbi:unnamed protein product [Effrenium voratum]|nr:unnamed protein product [Effrenium voratum]